jgi:excinuclease UvrABC nuclease subunit
MTAEPARLELPPPGPELDAVLQALPDEPAVFLLHAAEGRPYLSKTTTLGRRIRRLLRSSDRVRGALNLQGVVQRLDYWVLSSRLESALRFYTLARTYFPGSYLKLCNLRMPSYVKVQLSSPFPRTQATTRPGGKGLAFGPFRSRASAEDFEHAVLDLFQVRRCQEDLAPSPDHPGCIYGEMGQCLRPCQEAVTKAEYASEVDRLVEFLTTSGRSLMDVVESMRDRYSAEMEFEEAARQHKRLEKIRAAWQLRDELAGDVHSFHGVAVVPSRTPRQVALLFLLDSTWLPPLEFSLDAPDGRPISLDRRLKEVIDGLYVKPVTGFERQEHLALLTRWYYSSWRDGEWLFFSRRDQVSYRKLVHMVHRVAAK